MGKVDRLRNKAEPFAAFFALTALYLPTSDPACRPGITPPPYTKHVLKWSYLVQFSKRTLPPPPSLSYLGILFIYGCKALHDTARFAPPCPGYGSGGRILPLPLYERQLVRAMVVVDGYCPSPFISGNLSRLW